MENINKQNKFASFVKSSYFKTICSGILLFAAAMAFVPAAGVIRTLPLLFAVGIVLGVIDSPMGINCALCGVMTVSAYLVSGRGVVEAVCCTLVAELLVILGIYVFKLFSIAKKTQKKSVKKKCVSLCVLSFVIAIVLSFVVCGNIFSFLGHDSGNEAYLKLHYGEEVEKRYTSYEASAGEYRTYVSFRDGDSVYGNDDSCYISKKRGVLTDGIRDFYESAMLEAANIKLASVISNATWGFNVAASDLDFADGEVLRSDASLDDYMSRIGYVVCFDSIIGEKEKDKFVPICQDAVYALKQSGFEFESIVFCAGRADKVLFSLVVTPGTEISDVDSMIEKFDEKKLADFNVSEETVLEYWLNK